MYRTNLNMNKFCLYCFVIICGGISATGAVSISGNGDHVQHKRKEVLEGANIKLTCNTTELHDVESFFWIKNVTSGGGKSEKIDDVSWELEISAISRSEAGTYVCHAVLNSTGDNVTLSVTDVDVQYPAEVKSMSLSPQIMLPNQTFELNCSLRANPGPVWSIFNNVTGETIMVGRGSMLSFHAAGTFRIANQSEHGADVSLTNLPVKCGDSGYWMCSGYNALNHGVNTTRGFPLKVACPPQPIPFHPSEHVYTYKARVGDDVTMSLNVTSDAEPMFWWSHEDGSAIKQPFDVVSTSTGTSLTLKDVDVDDFGKYVLQCFNIYGYFWAHFDIQGNPGEPYNVHVSNIDKTSVDLSWVSGSDMGSHQTFFIVKWIKNEFIQISDIIQGPYLDGGEGKIWTYHQTGLEDHTEYKLAVVASNAVGLTFSDPVVFNTSSPASPVARDGVRSHIYIRAIIGGSVGLVVVAIVIIAIFARAAYKDRQSYNLNGKKRLLQNIQTEYGGTLTGDLKKQRPSSDVTNDKPKSSVAADEYTNRF